MRKKKYKALTIKPNLLAKGFGNKLCKALHIDSKEMMRFAVRQLWSKKMKDIWEYKMKEGWNNPEIEFIYNKLSEVIEENEYGGENYGLKKPYKRGEDRENDDWENINWCIDFLVQAGHRFENRLENEHWEDGCSSWPCCSFRSRVCAKEPS